jgi:hypothetical protein
MTFIFFFLRSNSSRYGMTVSNDLVYLSLGMEFYLIHASALSPTLFIMDTPIIYLFYLR